MGVKRGSNEDIEIGDIFNCRQSGDPAWFSRPDYYQVVALRGRTQVILRAIRTEKYIRDGIAEDSPIHWGTGRKRPLPGQFMTAAEIEYDVGDYLFSWRGKEFRMPTGEITAWVLPFRSAEGMPVLEEIQGKYHFIYSLALPEDREPRDTETIKNQEEDARTEQAAMIEELRRSWGLKPVGEADKTLQIDPGSRI